jgi:hypothetical protein
MMINSKQPDYLVTVQKLDLLNVALPSWSLAAIYLREMQSIAQHIYFLVAWCIRESPSAISAVKP